MHTSWPGLPPAVKRDGYLLMELLNRSWVNPCPTHSMPWLGTGFRAVSSWQKTQFRDTEMPQELGVWSRSSSTFHCWSLGKKCHRAATSVPATTVPWSLMLAEGMLWPCSLHTTTLHWRLDDHRKRKDTTILLHLSGVTDSHAGYLSVYPVFLSYVDR